MLLNESRNIPELLRRSCETRFLIRVQIKITLSSNRRATKYLKSRRPVEQKSQTVSQLLLDSSETRLWLCLGFPMDTGNTTESRWQHDSSVVHWSVACWLMLHVMLLKCEIEYRKIHVSWSMKNLHHTDA